MLPIVKVDLSDVLVEETTRGRLEALARDLGEDVGQVITRLLDERIEINRLTPTELTQLGDELASASHPVEVSRLRERLTRGFYGD